MPGTPGPGRWSQSTPARGLCPRANGPTRGHADQPRSTPPDAQRMKAGGYEAGHVSGHYAVASASIWRISATLGTRPDTMTFSSTTRAGVDMTP
jgi:hypothetical protein